MCTHVDRQTDTRARPHTHAHTRTHARTCKPACRILSQPWTRPYSLATEIIVFWLRVKRLFPATWPLSDLFRNISHSRLFLCCTEVQLFHSTVMPATPYVYFFYYYGQVATSKRNAVRTCATLGGDIPHYGPPGAIYLKGTVSFSHFTRGANIILRQPAILLCQSKKCCVPHRLSHESLSMYFLLCSLLLYQLGNFTLSCSLFYLAVL